MGGRCGPSGLGVHRRAEWPWCHAPGHVTARSLSLVASCATDPTTWHSIASIIHSVLVSGHHRSHFSRRCFYFLCLVLLQLTINPGLYFKRKSMSYTHTILRKWGTYSRPPMPIYAAVIAQMPSINTPTIRRLLREPLPAFWSSADLETWMVDCHWLIARDLCVYAGFYVAYKIIPSPWNGTRTAIA